MASSRSISIFTSIDPLRVGARPPPRNAPLRFESHDPQLGSPFYNGLIPAEIRDYIFQYALSEYIEHYYPQDTDYTRPEHPGHKRVSTSLLRACRRIYLETQHLPACNKSHVFWHYAGPANLPYLGDERGYFRRFTSEQLAHVQEIHLYAQQFWLDGSFAALCRLHYLQGVRRLRITLRRGDWWSVENNAPLAISPQRSQADAGSMRADWAVLDAGGRLKWDGACWGNAFRYLNGLKELEMELETYEYKKDELDEIVRHAVQWRFPMGEGRVLSAEGLAVEVRRWRGPPCGWSRRCYKCEGRDKDCKHCDEIRRLKSEGKGPMLIVMRLRWKLVAAT